jgi:uncharacterized protein
VSTEAFFLPAASGQRLCLYHRPSVQAAARGAVLYLHPWAEEMNKSRRMAAQQSHALAGAGYAVLQIDLHGCGDSSDTWAEASWDGWTADALLGAQWLLARHPATPQAPLWLWGLRAGALLACAAAARLPVPCRLLFWQPAPAGRPLLQQFLRLKAAANLQGDAKTTVDAVRRGLAGGQAQDIAGYPLSAALAHGLEAAQLTPPPQPTQVVWLEVSSRPEAQLLPASQAAASAWRAAGHRLHTQVVPGPAFWQTQEIEDAPALLAATLAAMLTPAATLVPAVQAELQA